MRAEAARQPSMVAPAIRFRASRSSAESMRDWPALVPSLTRRAATTSSATPSGERRSLSRPARSLHQTRGHGRRARRHHGTRSDRAWAQHVLPGGPPGQARSDVTYSVQQTPLTNGKTNTEIFRCLIRAIARQTWHPLVHPASAPRTDDRDAQRSSPGLLIAPRRAMVQFAPVVTRRSSCAAAAWLRSRSQPPSSVKATDRCKSRSSIAAATLVSPGRWGHSPARR